jgi:hypothetical protein
MSRMSICHAPILSPHIAIAYIPPRARHVEPCPSGFFGSEDLASVCGHLEDSELIVKPAELNNQAGFLFIQNDSS